MLKLELYVPQVLENKEDVKEVGMPLEEVKSSLGVDVEKFVIDESGEADLRSKVLWRLSVIDGIKIKQTRKSKSLYPQLIILKNGRSITFYPQARTGRRITVKEFLGGLLRGEVPCLHEKLEIEDGLRGERRR